MGVMLSRKEEVRINKIDYTFKRILSSKKFISEIIIKLFHLSYFL